MMQDHKITGAKLYSRPSTLKSTGVNVPTAPMESVTTHSTSVAKKSRLCHCVAAVAAAQYALSIPYMLRNTDAVSLLSVLL